MLCVSDVTATWPPLRIDDHNPIEHGWFQAETMVRRAIISGPMVSAFHGLGVETVVTGGSVVSVYHYYGSPMNTIENC